MCTIGAQVKPHPGSRFDPLLPHQRRIAGRNRREDCLDTGWTVSTVKKGVGTLSVDLQALADRIVVCYNKNRKVTIRMGFEFKMPEYELDGVKYSLCFNGKWQLRLRISGNGRVPGAGEFQPWHKNASRIEDIYIDYSIKEVGARAFAGYPNLEQVWICDTITKIGEGAFADCPNLERVRIEGRQLTRMEYLKTILPEQFFKIDDEEEESEGESTPV